jgi:hypothetical protein
MSVDHVVNAPANPITKNAFELIELFIVKPNMNEPMMLTKNIPNGCDVNLRMY